MTAPLDLPALKALIAAATPGPLTVSVSEKFPFSILTRNADGVVVVGDNMPCHTSKDQTLTECLTARNWKPHEREQIVALNARAVADAQLNAAARTALPGLVEEVERLKAALEDVVSPLGVLQRDAEARGCKLGGRAWEIANSLSFVQNIARAALKGDQA